jgi:hypothetical protein
MEVIIPICVGIGPMNLLRYKELFQEFIFGLVFELGRSTRYPLQFNGRSEMTDLRWNRAGNFVVPD